MLDEVDFCIIIYGEGWDMGIGFVIYDKVKKDNVY